MIVSCGDKRLATVIRNYVLFSLMWSRTSSPIGGRVSPALQGVLEWWQPPWQTELRTQLPWGSLHCLSAFHWPLGLLQDLLGGGRWSSEREHTYQVPRQKWTWTICQGCWWWDGEHYLGACTQGMCNYGGNLSFGSNWGSSVQVWQYVYGCIHDSLILLTIPTLSSSLNSSYDLELRSDGGNLVHHLEDCLYIHACKIEEERAKINEMARSKDTEGMFEHEGKVINNICAIDTLMFDRI